MTSVAPKHHNDADRIKTISEKFLENDELTGLIDELAGSTNNADDLVKGLLQASLNRGLSAELDTHLGYAKGDREARQKTASTNSRNGTYPKTVDTTYGPIDLDVPRDRAGSFIPKMVPKGSRRLGGLDEQIISLYAGGMTIRDIQHHLATTLGTDLSHETISTITDAVLDEVMIWQKRQLDSFYPVVYLDAIRIKVRDNHRVVGKSAYLAVGVDLDGVKHVLGIKDPGHRRSRILGARVRGSSQPRHRGRVDRLL